MGEPVIQLENIAVQYRSPSEKIPSFKEFAIRWIQGKIRYEHFWALKGVSVDIREGEVFGIIGPNGAGKSTLLKVVARVLRPTRGRVRVRGLVAPLLELGAGFDYELTGRENIYLNGAVLGLSKKELDSRFDHILEFSGLREFVDAPLRTYSSGMVARLGFSVATERRPEVLIVDEILGVGDTDFQNKSLERIRQFQRQGTTILLVSHSLDSVTQMCSRAIWLDHGEKIAEGPAPEMVGRYLQHTYETEGKRLAAESAQERETTREAAKPPSKVKITRVCLTDLAGNERFIFETNCPFQIRMEYTSQGPVEAPVFGIAIHRGDGVHVTGPNTDVSNQPVPRIDGKGTVIYTCERLPLLAGLYQVSVAAVNKENTELFDYHDRLYSFRVVNDPKKVKESLGLFTFDGNWAHQPGAPEAHE
ncbi:MAG TPA: ABC transporter ATP-binding protein [Anaerolineales bacterium]|nr:ABC transporter ATP-binding protein [Anaerolineales bacterium]